MNQSLKGACGVPLTDQENKQLQLALLRFIAQYCEKHHLRYFLGDGTLLGAIRHKGYIPWDDDIDLRMPRPDYNKIIKSFNANSNSNIYKLINPKYPEAQHHFIKIIDTRTIKIEPGLDYSLGFLGVDVDIFPFDGCPDDEPDFLKFAKDITAYDKAFVYKKRNAFRSFLSIAKDIVCSRTKAKFVPWKSCSEIVSEVEKIMMAYDFDKSNYICSVNDMECFRFSRDSVKDYVMVQFEGEEYRAPIGYDEVLTQQYGDYMKLPPVEERVTHHVNNVYWKINK